jgi:hypothetical protein
MSDPYIVYIFNTWKIAPVYHDYGRIRTFDGDDMNVGDVTACGRVMYRHGKDLVRAALRRDHADLFAVPCAKCFPAPVGVSPTSETGKPSSGSRPRPRTSETGH